MENANITKSASALKPYSRSTRDNNCGASNQAENPINDGKAKGLIWASGTGGKGGVVSRTGAEGGEGGLASLSRGVPKELNPVGTGGEGGGYKVSSDGATAEGGKGGKVVWNVSPF